MGIFSIVAVFCAVDSLRDNIMEGVRSFGSDVVYIDRFPMSQEEDENGELLNWWDYLQRPEITEEDFEFVSRNASLSKSVVYVVMGNGNASYRRRSYDNAYLLITTGGLEGVMNIELENGRNFSEQEARGGANVAVLGHSVAQELFGNEDPVGKKVKIRGSRAIVVGVLAAQGESMASMVDTDNAVILPLQYGKTVLASSWGSGMMLAAPADGVDRQAFLDELRMLMRSCHGLSPAERDDFSLNEMTFLLDMLDTVFSGIARAGWIIGAFSLIIGSQHHVCLRAGAHEPDWDSESSGSQTVRHHDPVHGGGIIPVPCRWSDWHPAGAAGLAAGQCILPVIHYLGVLGQCPWRHAHSGGSRHPLRPHSSLEGRDGRSSPRYQRLILTVRIFN